MQLAFENGVESPLFESSRAQGELHSIKVNTDIRFVSLKVYYGYLYNGFRFYDKDQQIIAEQSNDDGYALSIWSPLVEIPFG